MSGLANDPSSDVGRLSKRLKTSIVDGIDDRDGPFEGWGVEVRSCGRDPLPPPPIGDRDGERPGMLDGSEELRRSGGILASLRSRSFTSLSSWSSGEVAREAPPGDR